MATQQRKGFNIPSKRKSATDPTAATKWRARTMAEMSEAELARLEMRAKQFLSLEAMAYRAMKVLGAPQRHGAGWRVPSATTPGGFHSVYITPRLRCTCSAWIYGRGKPCRHLRVVLDLESGVSMAD